MLETYELLCYDPPLPLKPKEADCMIMLMMLNPFVDWRKQIGKKLD